MHIADDSASAPIQGVDDLIAYFRAAGRAPEGWLVGSEHELIGVWPDGRAPSYADPRGIAAVLAGFEARGWTPVREGDHTIALIRGSAQITLEPGGQFELAAGPVADDRAFARDLAEHLADLRAITGPMGITWLSSGFRPFGTRADVPWMPKARYDVMRAYMPTVGTRGLDMMLRTATVQSNLDFADEADAARKMRGLMGVTSILTALWANSPIVEGEVTDYQSYRAWVWRDTDRARSGSLPFVFERDDLFTAYTEWALDVPMYFLFRGGYRPVSDLTFRQFLHQGHHGEHATINDWALHLSTLFPDIRLKKLLEVRGCDCGSEAMIAALAPLSKGLAYDATALDATIALTRAWTWAEREALADDVPRAGLQARVHGQTVGELARELVAIADDGLARLAPHERGLLAPLHEIVATGMTQATRAAAAWRAAPDVATKIAALALR